MEQFEKQIGELKLRYFTAGELLVKTSATRNGVKNTLPPVEMWGNIERTAIVLDEIRERGGRPIELLSGYRSPSYNRAVGGESASFHMRFLALDFTWDGDIGKLWTLAKSMRGNRFMHRGRAFVFAGGIGKYPSFVHLDTRGNDANW